MFYYDTRYIMMLLPVLAITLYAQWKVNSSFRRYGKITNRRRGPSRPRSAPPPRGSQRAY